MRDKVRLASTDEKGNLQLECYIDFTNRLIQTSLVSSLQLAFDGSEKY